MAKEITIHEVDFIEGGISDFIFWGQTETGKRVKVWVPEATLLDLAEKTKIAGSPGHAVWHRHNGGEMPCEMCSGKEQAQIAELERKLKELDPEQEGEEYEGKSDGLLAQIQAIKSELLRERGISL